MQNAQTHSFISREPKTSNSGSHPEFDAATQDSQPHAPIAAPVPSDILAEELSRLPASQTLHVSGDYRVLLVRGAQVPSVMREIGRLREVSFRAVGEGTGKALDIDVYDDWYLQLLVWHQSQRQVLGAYRLCMTDVVYREVGVDGLYTKSLFVYDDSFLSRLGPALEMGRSFVRPELQGAGRVLALLWRGVGRLVSACPRYRQLFGPVSVSSTYSAQSRHLIAGSLSTGQFRHELYGAVAPLRPVAGLEPASLAQDITDLSKRVTSQELDGKGLPILVKEYAKLGGRFLAFSVDPSFGDAMDGLVAVDLDRTAPRLLQLYMGPDNYKRFKLGLPTPEIRENPTSLP